MPTLQQLRYLSALATTLNFSRAAELCNVTQPTLSLQIKELEARLGTQLIERTRSKVLLTPVGAEIAKRGRMIGEGIEDIRDIARREDPNAMQSLLRMGVVHTVGAYVLSVTMPALREAYSETRIHVREDRSEILQDHLGQGQYDVLLLSEPPPRDDFDSRILLREALHVVVPRDHRLAANTVINASDLTGETILTMDCGKILTEKISRLCHAIGAVQAKEYVGTTLDTLRQMVAAGMGISLLPALYVRSEVIREELVVAIPLSKDLLSREVCMVWRKSSPRVATYSSLSELMQKRLKPWNVAGFRG